jgi:hypothetical protein
MTHTTVGYVSFQLTTPIPLLQQCEILNFLLQILTTLLYRQLLTLLTLVFVANLSVYSDWES